ncbi:MAG TPA: SRPBCC domain-containing protein [Polyangiaceae bacterium]
MTRPATRAPLPGDQARVSVLVEVPPAEAFRAFVEDIDLWWRHGLKYRVAGKRRGIVHLEAKVDGRLFESFQTARGAVKIVQTGRVLRYEPPSLLTFEWRNVNFAAHEATHVEVRFDPSPSGTVVALTHSGWSAIRPDHPARHGQATEAFVRSLGLWWGELLTSLRLHCLP